MGRSTSSEAGLGEGASMSAALLPRVRILAVCDEVVASEIEADV
jgi:hypothetical protein